jgi:hypothetical protein
MTAAPTPTFSLTKDAAEKFMTSNEFQAAMRHLRAARRSAKEIRAKVDGYTLEVFKRYRFKVAPDNVDLGDKLTGVSEDGTITDPAMLYLTDLDADEMKRYDAEMGATHTAHGFAVAEGQCPALVAESEVRRAEHAVVHLACKHLYKSTPPVTQSLRDRLLSILEKTDDHLLAIAAMNETNPTPLPR